MKLTLTELRTILALKKVRKQSRDDEFKALIDFLIEEITGEPAEVFLREYNVEGLGVFPSLTITNDTKKAIH